MPRFQEWLSRNSHRKFPFKETSTMVTSSGIDIPQDFLVDFSCYVPLRENARYRIGRIDTNIAEVRLLLMDDLDVILGSTTILVSGHTPGDDYDIVTASTNYVSGKVTVGAGLFKIVETFFPGNHSLTLNQSELEPGVLIPTDIGIVTSVGIFDEPLESFLKGDVSIRGGRGIEIEIINTETGEGPPNEVDPDKNCIRISAIHRIEPSECAFIRGGTPLQSINNHFIFPGEGSSLFIDAEGLFTLDVERNRLKIGTTGLPEANCVRPFETYLRGSGGASGIRGDQGPPGENVECECLCPTCQQCNLNEGTCRVCDACQLGDGGTCVRCNTCEIEAPESPCEFCDLHQAFDFSLSKSFLFQEGFLVSDSIQVEIT